MAKKKILISPNDGQSFNPADYTTYDEINSPKNDFKPSENVSGYNYERDSSVDKPTITPYDLPNLNDERAANQSTVRSLGDSFAKFAGKTVLSTIGNLAGTVYGVGDAIAKGDVTKIWDNSFMDAVDAGDKKLDNIFQVYKSSDYLDQNFLQKLFLHPTKFIDEATDTASFMAGAVLSEIATSGLGSETIVPKALKYMKYLSEGAESTEATRALMSLATKGITLAGDLGTSIKHLAMGASYEGIVEARQATMELRDKMYKDYSDSHPGEEIPQTIKDDIDDRLSKAGTFTYLANLALVGETNLLLFPKLFGLGHDTAKIATGAIEKNLETGLFESTVDKKLAETGSKYSLLDNLKTGLTKPFQESTKFGVQGTISNTARDFWDRKNDPESKKNVLDFLDNFGSHLIDTYTSKEGWNNIGMGMIIGALGAPGRGILSPLGEDNPLGKYGYKDITDDKGNITGKEKLPLWTGGVKGSFDERAEEEHKVGKVLNDLNQNTNFFKAMKANYDFNVQNKTLQNEQDEALKVGNIFDFQNAKDDQIHSYVSSRIKNNLFDDLLSEVDKMKQLSPEEFYTNFKGEEANDTATTPEKIRFQQETVQQFLDKANNTKEAIKIADNVYRGDNDDLREELVHSIAASKNLDIREKQMNQSLADLSDGMISNYTLRGNNDSFLKGTIDHIKEQLKDPDITDEDKSMLTKQLSNTTIALQSPEHSAWNYLKEHNPTAATLNGNKIIQLLTDSKKLREKRQDYLDLYNHLYTQEGQRQFTQHQQNLVDIAQKQQEKSIKEETEKQAEEDKKKNIKDTIDKVETLKDIDNTKAIDNDNIPNVNFDEKENKDIIPRDQEEIKQDLTNNTDTHVEALNNGDKNTTIETLNKEDQLKQELAKSLTTIVPEETAIVNIEEHKDLVAQREVILHEDGLVKNSTVPPNRRLGDLNIINLDRKRTIGNTIAYLGQDKIELGKVDDEGNIIHKTYNTFNEDGSVQINEYVDTKLFSQNYYNSGSKVNMRVPSFEEMQDRGLQNYTEINYLDNRNIIEEFPIAIYSDNKIIGYLPTQSSIEKLVTDEFKEVALAQNLSLRRVIFENKEDSHTTTITSKSPGFLILDHPDNQKNLFESLGDKTKLADKVMLGVTKLGDLYINNRDVFSNGDIVNPSEEEGVIVAIVPSSQQGEYIIYPMKTNTIGVDNAKTIVEAIRLFAKGDNITETEKKSLDNITEFNFKNFDDVTSFVNKIMYASSKVSASEETTFKLYKDNLILSKLDDNKKFSLRDVVSNQSTRDQLVDILSNRYHSVSLDNLNNTKEYTSYSLDKDNIIQENSYPTYQNYLNDNNVITSNIRGIQIEGNEYAFTTQPVIGLSNSLTKETKELQQTNIKNLEPISPIESEPIREEAREPKLTKKILFDPTKVKPKSLEDINPEFIEQQSIKSGEDLKKKCL